MSSTRNKELVCLLAAVVSEMLDDSDDEEDLLPLKAVLQARTAVDGEEPPSPKKPKNVEHKAHQEIDKYSQPSRFEDSSIFEWINTVDVGELICKTSLKPTTQCFCSNHINLQSLSLFSLLVVNQIGGELLTDIDFKTNWHMTKGTVEALYQILFCNGQEQPSISAMEFLAFLWSLATNEAADGVETRFKMSKGELNLLERKIYDVLLSKRFCYERWPQGVAASFVSEGFRNICGFSGALGVVDCVHFPYIGTPYPGTYQNRRNDKTVIFELACDHRGIFTYSSYFWWPGKWTHMDVHHKSSLSTYPIPEGFFLLADRSYALEPNYLTPFAEPKKASMKKFNEQHLWATNIMKHAIGCLATRFKAVKYFAERTPWVLRKRFAACLLLHNLCTELEGAIAIDDTLDLSPYFPPDSLPPDRDAEELLRKRVLSEMIAIETHHDRSD